LSRFSTCWYQYGIVGGWSYALGICAYAMVVETIVVGRITKSVVVCSMTDVARTVDVASIVMVDVTVVVAALAVNVLCVTPRHLHAGR